MAIQSSVFGFFSSSSFFAFKKREKNLLRGMADCWPLTLTNVWPHGDDFGDPRTAITLSRDFQNDCLTVFGKNLTIEQFNSFYCGADL